MLVGGPGGAERMTRRGLLKIGTGSVVLGGLARYAPSVLAAPARTLRVASGESDGPSGTMDPAFSASDPDAARISAVYERLVVLDDGFAPRPELATSWESNSTADVWTFKLRRGVEFQDGRKFTAGDAVYTYRRLLDPKTGSAAKALLEGVGPDGITALDDYTVRFMLSTPNVEFPLTIANRFTYIVPQGSTSEDLRARGIGTGPFRVEKFVPGEEPSIFRRNERYWQRGLPLVDTLELRAIPEEAARVAALQRGQVDVVMDIPLTSVTALVRDRRVKVIRARSPFILTMACWTDTPPFDDDRVRLAMKYCVDRRKMLQVVLNGYGDVANDDPVAPWVQYALGESPRQQDTTKAKMLLAEAGHKDGLSVQLWTSSATTGMVEMATAFKEMAAPAGINVEIKEAPSTDYWDKVWLKQPFVCSSWSGRPADEALAVGHLSSSKWNETHWHRPDWDRLILDARKTVNFEARKALYQKAQRVLIDEGGDLIPVFVNATSATRADVRGWAPHAQKFYKNFTRVGFAG